MGINKNEGVRSSKPLEALEELEALEDKMQTEDKLKGGPKETSSSELNHLVGYTEPFYYCKQHTKVQNIHREEIEFHVLHSTRHQLP